MQPPYTIAVIGLWHLGEVYSAGLAELGYRVIGIDGNQKVVDNFLKNTPPLAEPRLVELLESCQPSGQLTYTTDFAKVSECNVVWLTFDTPVDDNDEVDVKVIFESLKKALPYLQNDVLIVASSQLPVGTSEKITELVRERRPELAFHYAYSPENLRLGDAVRCFLEPGRVVVGADTPEALKRVKVIFSKLSANVVAMSPVSAEIAKHALNAFLATSISFTNDIADVCEVMGGDVEDVVAALRSDSRIGPKAYLFAGLGFSGGTLGRDVKALLHVADERRLSLPIIAGILEKNSTRGQLVLHRLEEEIGSVKGKVIAMFGVTYKAGTSTLRRSQALEVEAGLREAGATLRLYDALAEPDEIVRATPSPFFSDPYEAARGAEAILIMTPSAEFKKLKFSKLKVAVKSSLIFDTCNILPDREEEIEKAGFRYIRIGK